jgi:hypothetical protein
MSCNRCFQGAGDYRVQKAIGFTTVDLQLKE